MDSSFVDSRKDSGEATGQNGAENNAAGPGLKDQKALSLKETAELFDDRCVIGQSVLTRSNHISQSSPISSPTHDRTNNHIRQGRR